MPTTIEVEVQGRANAVRLLERLCFCRAYLVQHGRERWVVHAQIPDPQVKTLEDTLAAIEELSRGGHLDATSIRIDGLAYGRALTEGRFSIGSGPPRPEIERAGGMTDLRRLHSTTFRVGPGMILRRRAFADRPL
jgi:hypothetical protein